jgi:hypothetical protein
MTPQYPNANADLVSRFAVAGERLPARVPTRFLGASFIIFLSTLLLYLGLAFGYKPFLQNSVDELKKKTSTLGLQLSSSQQEEVFKLYSQINNLPKLLSEHVVVSPFLNFLESHTLKRVVYKTIDLSIEDRRLLIDGVAASYDDLAAQLKIYESAPEVERVTLENASRQGSIVAFKATVTLSPQIFKSH